MEIAPIRTEPDRRRALEEIKALMTAERDTPEGDRLDVLVTRVEAWEARHYPLDLKMIRRLHKGLGIPAESLIKMEERQAA